VARFPPTHVGKLQRKALALSNADEAVSLNRKGWSGEAIAAHLNVSTKTVQNYLRRFLAAESRYGLEITGEVVAEMRAAFIRAHASLASMYGLNVPEERNGSGNTTNNTINSINMGESEFLRHLCNVKGIKLANG
jgi:hypothetical protein